MNYPKFRWETRSKSAETFDRTNNFKKAKSVGNLKRLEKRLEKVRKKSTPYNSLVSNLLCY